VRFELQFYGALYPALIPLSAQQGSNPALGIEASESAKQCSARKAELFTHKRLEDAQSPGHFQRCAAFTAGFPLRFGVLKR